MAGVIFPTSPGHKWLYIQKIKKLMMPVYNVAMIFFHVFVEKASMHRLTLA